MRRLDAAEAFAVATEPKKRAFSAATVTLCGRMNAAVSWAGALRYGVRRLERAAEDDIGQNIGTQEQRVGCGTMPYGRRWTGMPDVGAVF